MKGFPEKFFKFRNWSETNQNYTRAILEEGAFYCSGPREFDDPQDNQLGAHATGSNLDIDRFLFHDMAGICEIGRKYSLSSLIYFNEKTVTDREDNEVIEAFIGRRQRRHTRVLCFSANLKSDLMWAFYADKHQGICLCFDTRHKFFRKAMPVIYTSSPTPPYALNKSLDWKFQEEWRVVFPGDEPKKVEFPRSSLTDVILGYRFPERLLDDLKQVLTSGGYRVNISRIERIPDSFDLDLIQVGSTS